MLVENQLSVYSQLQKQAIEYLNEGQFIEAIANYEKCIKADINYIFNYWYLGLALLLEGNKIEAQAVWLSVITQIQAEDIDNYLKELINILEDYALRYFKSGIFPQAKSLFWQILEFDAKQLKAYINLGAIFAYQNDLNAANDYFYKAIEIQSDCAEAYFNLGIILEIQGELEKAILYFSKAIEHQPNFIEAHKKLRFMLEMLRSQEAGYSSRSGQGYRIWDPWLLKDGDIYRLFYLSSDNKSHYFWSVGEVGAAISTDMKKWNSLGIVHKANPKNEWENGRILAGNVYKENGIYYLFYSGSPAGRYLLNEKISLATSVDGENWKRHSDFLLKPDIRFYTYSCNFQLTGEEGINIEEHWQWRDPYIVKEPVTGKYYMFITAAAAKGNPYFRGCIGLAVADKIGGIYEILPPATYPMIDKI